MLTAAQRELLARRVGAATRRARSRGRPIIAAVTASAPASIDPAAVVLAARRGGDRWTCLEQPERDGVAIAGLGDALAIAPGAGDGATVIGSLGAGVAASSVEQLPAHVAASCAEHLAGAYIDDPADDPTAPPGAGVIWMGGWAFDPERVVEERWSDFGPARHVLPEIAIARRLGIEPAARVTATVVARPGDDANELMASIDSRLDAAGRSRNAAPATAAAGNAMRSRQVDADPSPDAYRSAVTRAVELIHRGAFEKIVLARAITVSAPINFDHAVVFARLRAKFPGCFCFATGAGERVFAGASPELLVRREGRRATTIALAGSAPRGRDEGADERLAGSLLENAKDRHEHAVVVRRIERALGAISAWVSVADPPRVVRLANVQHLATPIRAQLLAPRPVLDLAGILHPTPAVGGEPWPAARAHLADLEAIERGWYAGPIGWMDAVEDGEYCVALRCALIDGSTARLYAGAGIVAGSDPDAELAETETKFAAVLDVLGCHRD